MIIALTGYMGSGKTTVGRIVADALGCVFLDLDALIEKKAGKSVAEIFASDGEPAFRTLEATVLADTVKRYAQGDAVLALGGGTILNPDSRRLLREKTLCIWLDAPAEVLWERISVISTNPVPSSVISTEQSARRDPLPSRPLADEDFAARLTARLPLYAEAAEVTIDTSGLTPQDVADEIIISCL